MFTERFMEENQQMLKGILYVKRDKYFLEI